MFNFFKPRKSRVDDLLIDLVAYEAQLIRSLELGGMLRPVPSLLGGPDYDNFTHAEMRQLEDNRTVAERLFKRAQEGRL